MQKGLPKAVKAFPGSWCCFGRLFDLRVRLAVERGESEDGGPLTPAGPVAPRSARMWPALHHAPGDLGVLPQLLGQETIDYSSLKPMSGFPLNRACGVLGTVKHSASPCTADGGRRAEPTLSSGSAFETVLEEDLSIFTATGPGAGTHVACADWYTRKPGGKWNTGLLFKAAP